MKKCPRCGAILDDSKVKCYICGTDLRRQTLTKFGDSFDSTIGAAVTGSQTNVFNSNKQVFGNNINQTNGAVQSGTSFSNSFYNNQLNGLNSMAYDDRTALEKMFSSDERFKSKTEINAQKALRDNKKRNDFANLFSNNAGNGKNEAETFNNDFKRKNPISKGGNQQNLNNVANINQAAQQNFNINQQRPIQQVVNQQVVNQQVVNQNVNRQNTQTIPVQQVASNNTAAKNKVNLFTNLKNKFSNKNNATNAKQGGAPINWGNELNNNKDKGKTGFKVNGSLIFNVVALLISIAGVLFIYFKFIKTDDTGNVYTFSGLKYSIPNNFIVKDEKNGYRLYTYGEYCSISLTSGATTAVDSYVDGLYESIKEKYDSEEFSVSKSTAKYDDNVWTEINVLNLAANAASANGYTTQTKIQYVSIVYESNFYTIVYQNTNGNTICSASYDSFLKTLSFK